MQVDDFAEISVCKIKQLNEGGEGICILRNPACIVLLHMTVNDVKNILDAKIWCCEHKLDAEVHSACGSDMMSDVLAFVKDQSVLLSGLVNPQVIRTAEMMDILCVIFVRGKEPNETILELAREKDICIMTTPRRMFTACGLLYENGLRGGGNA